MNAPFAPQRDSGLTWRRVTEQRRSVGDSGVARGEVGPGDLEIQRWLADGFVAHVNQRFCFGLAAGSEAGLPVSSQ